MKAIKAADLLLLGNAVRPPLSDEVNGRCCYSPNGGRGFGRWSIVNRHRNLECGRAVRQLSVASCDGRGR